ncbi:phosphoribosyl-AMP cyclohydrolase [Nesterenkonia cremea]|uniref:phosphoribosyl-AMP cyclohydrolase n=1 Tax=Nesterenkonia cremea TaxID=1882340 RepID=UPI003570AA5C
MPLDAETYTLDEDIRSRLRMDTSGLVPAIAQDAGTGEVLMMAWMNEEALAATLATREGTYWSRSRQELWRKGATSGNTQRVASVALDCDGDTILLRVEQQGPACHTGAPTCFSGRELTLGEAS